MNEELKKRVDELQEEIEADENKMCELVLLNDRRCFECRHTTRTTSRTYTLNYGDYFSRYYYVVGEFIETKARLLDLEEDHEKVKTENERLKLLVTRLETQNARLEAEKARLVAVRVEPAIVETLEAPTSSLPPPYFHRHKPHHHHRVPGGRS